VLQLEGRWADLGPLSTQLGAVPAHFLPEATLSEMVIAQREYENSRIVTVCSEAIEQGYVSGTPGHINLTAISTSPVVQAIRLASQLQCRTEQASWVSRLAEAVLEMRTCVKSMDFKNMQRAVLAVKAMDNINVEVGVASDVFPRAMLRAE
jgi:hypothetical protein